MLVTIDRLKQSHEAIVTIIITKLRMTDVIHYPESLNTYGR